MNQREDNHDAAIAQIQLRQLNDLLAVARKRPFYASRLAQIDLPLRSLGELTQLPLLTKSDLMPASLGEPARNFDLPRREYVRLHQTSGTSGFPMVVLDTANDWRGWLDCWDHVLDSAAIDAGDTAMMAFSFGPFIGFWTAADALVRRGVLVVPGGGMSSEARLEVIDSQRCNVLCCTPTYALHLSAVAERAGIDLRAGPVEKIIVAGEPGGSIESVRGRIETAWGARLTDHAGGSEIGAWGFGSADGKGLHVIESAFIAEVLRFDDPDASDGPRQPVEDGQPGELVLTNLVRAGGPAIRYRTGDIVRPWRRPGERLFLDGGVIGRADDMLVIRGVNVFPSSIEAIIREIDATCEFRLIVTREDEMDQLAVEVEGDAELSRRIAERIRKRLALRTPVKPGRDLPRFEAKARRVIDRRAD